MTRSAPQHRRLFLHSEQLEARLVLDSTVVFSEIMYNPAGDSETLEWLELHNQMAVNVDLSGWQLDGGVDYTFPEGTVIKGGDYLVVAADVDALAADTGLPNLLGPYRGNLSNGGERLRLRNHTNRLMNEVEYDDKGDWPVLADGSGVSLAKAEEQTASHEPKNWRGSEQVGGTPGRVNFVRGGDFTRTVIVPLDSTWRYEQSGTNLNTAWRKPGYDDAAWEQGKALLFVESSSLPGPKNTPLDLGENTYYFRQQFEFAGDTTSATLQLNHIIDDGAVFYLNGQEIGRFNMDNGPVDFSTGTSDGISNATLNSTSSTLANLLQQGTNTLAVEVHQTSSNSSDIVMGLELSLLRELSASQADTLSFSEVSGLSPDPFWIELHNSGAAAADLTGFEIATNEQSYVLPNVTIPSGGYWSAGESELGWRPGLNAPVFLYAPHRGRVLDGVSVEETAQARSSEHQDRWQTPNTLTPNAANSFEFNRNIVINEIMYSARPTYSAPAQVQSNTVMEFDQTWRFEQSGTDLGSAWRLPQFDDATWETGQGLFFVERDDLPGPKSTELALGSPTFYFRTSFEVVDPANINLAVAHVIDDGAVFYLNGEEFSRFNMPSGPVTHSTFATATIRNATLESGASLPQDKLVAGTNYLAVEVHQQGPTNPDIVFGMQIREEATIIPGAEYSESDEEWIEFYNRGTQPVDLTNWSIADGVTFDFPAGTVLAPGDFTVVASNAAHLASKHPGIAIAGEFSGSLSNSGERIQLADARNNIADEVRYFDDGRWSAWADGNGSSLELQDPFADNATAEAWAASDESSRSEWQRISYRARAESIPHEPPIEFNEFVMGLLAQGEVLIDNLSVQSSSGVELIQNGSFENDIVGREPSTWRIQGTHEDSQVIVDPADPDNQVLQLIAEARMNYLGNHAETTLANGARVLEGSEYEISYDAKWITGSPQMHTELYYEDASRTTILRQPKIAGTPGAANSTAVSNLGPTYEHLSHSPTIPSSSESVTIRVTPHDADGMDSMTLFYSVNGGGFRSLSMTAAEDGSYSAEIPRQSNGRTVQFYVSGTDTRGATTLFPADGRESRALYKVDNSFARDPLRHDFQIIMEPSDANALHVNINILDNDRVGSTVIYNGSEVFYNTGTRLRGSMFSRNNQSRTGYNVKFNADQLFRGVHESIGFDQGGEREIIAKFTSLQTGNLGGTYDDVFDLETPSGSGGGPTLVYLARHQDLFLDEQFENGSDGTLFKMEGIRVMTSTVDGNPESRKIYQPIGWVSAFDIEDMGSDKEKYRWPFIINNNRKQDDYSRLIDMAQALDAPRSELQDAAMEVLDVDNVTQTFALMSLLGIGDTYSQGNPHNLNIYVRPSDDRVLMFPWDWDFTFNQSTSAPLHGGKNIGRVLDQPHFEHFLLGHMEHMINTRFNRSYMSPWTSHFGQMLGDNYDQFLTRIRDRGNFVKRRLPDNVAFEVTSSSVSDSIATLTGRGWVNVKELRLGVDSPPIDVEWTSATNWTAQLPLQPGDNHFDITAFDFGNEPVGVQSVDVTSTAPRPLHDFLRISEINYSPSDPTSDEIAAGQFEAKAFEFVELVNTSAGEQTMTLDLSNVQLADGIEFTFPSSTTLPAGKRVVVVSDLTAFRLRYGNEPRVVGQFDLQLNNQGERVSLLDDAGIEIMSVDYADKGLWPEAADGLGATLELNTLESLPGDSAGTFHRWRASTEFGGSPGREATPHSGIVISEILAAGNDAIELHNLSNAAVNIGGWYLSDDRDDLFDYQIPDGTTLAAGEYEVFDRSQFGFGLSSNGDDVWLVARNGNFPQFIDEAHFQATSNGQTLGRTNRSLGRLTPLTRNGLGYGNAQPLVSDSIIRTIQYLPAEPTAEALAIDPTITSEDLEYVAFNGTIGRGWKLAGGVEYTFPFDVSFALTPLPSHWLVSFDPASPANASKVLAFKKHYEAEQKFPTLLGGYNGSLKKSGEQIFLQRPAGDAAFETVDEVLYSTLDDWPTARTGDPIVRKSSTFFGNDGRNWTHESTLLANTPIQGDFNGDDLVDATDIDLLIDAVNRNSQNWDYVLSGTFPVPTQDEIRFFIREVIGSAYGDTNLDGLVNDQDTHVPGRTADGWRAGDFNGDNMVDDADLALAGVQPFAYDFALFLRLAANFGKSDLSRFDGDLDGDTIVGFADFLLFSARFGK